MGQKNKSIPEFDDKASWGKYRPQPVVGAVLRFGQMLPRALAPISKATRHPVKYWGTTPIDLKVWGLKLRLSPRGNISEQKLYTSPANFDRAELRELAKILSDGGTFVDIGVNAGAYSFWVHSCSKGRARVLGFEPDAEMRRRVTFNMKTNGIQNITLFPWALSDGEGTATLWENSSQRGTNSLVPPSNATTTDRRPVQVEIRTLAGVLAAQGITRVDAMKIDIEGHELPVLRHFFAHAPESTWPRVLIGEVLHLPAEELATLVPKEHYELVTRTELNAIWRRRR